MVPASTRPRETSARGAGAEHRQVEIAVDLEEVAGALVHATRDVLSPADSSRLLAELGRTTDHLQQVARQLRAWHRRVVDGREHRGERGDGVTGTLEAAAQLEAAADAFDHAREALRDAQTASGVVRWVDRR